MAKSITYVGLDVHKDTIAVGWPKATALARRAACLTAASTAPGSNQGAGCGGNHA
jgi:hypothetical protein